MRFFISAVVFLEKVTICDSNSIPRDFRSALASLQGTQNKAVYISTLLEEVILIFLSREILPANANALKSTINVYFIINLLDLLQ